MRQMEVVKKPRQHFEDDEAEGTEEPRPPRTVNGVSLPCIRLRLVDESEATALNRIAATRLLRPALPSDGRPHAGAPDGHDSSRAASRGS